MRMGVRLRAGLAAAAALALLPVSLHTAAAQDLKQVTVILPNPSALNVYAMHSAIGEGYMAEEGLDVSVEAVDGSALVLQAMAAGQAQIGEPGPAPLLAARARGEDVVFFYNLNPLSSFGVLVREESNYQVPTDLKGTVIGVGTADGAEVGFTRTILTANGMTEGTDYTFLPVGDGGTAAAAFERGDIEAYAAATSDAAILATRGLKLREITPDEYKSYFANGFAALRSYIDANPDVIEGFSRALTRGMEFSQDPANREKVLQHSAAANPQEGEDAALSDALLDQLLMKQDIGDQAEGWGYQRIEDWEKWQQSLLDSGGLTEPLDLNEAFTNDYIQPRS